MDLVIKFLDVVRGDQSEDNKVSLWNIIVNSIPVLIGLVIKDNNNKR